MSAEAIVAIVGLGAMIGGAVAVGLFAWVAVTSETHETLTPKRRRALIVASTLSLSVALVGLASMIGAAAVAIVRGLGLGS